MAVIIPDLFGAFQKGREYAIDRNWKDLENYETIEKMRTANDMAQLALLQERYYTPLKMNMFANNADNSEMQSQIQFTAFPGALSNARQFTNQAISNEGVQAATLGDTALANIAAITGNNAKTKAQGAIDVAQANNTDTGLVGKARADVVNEKARNALANIKIEQDIFKKSSEEKLLAINNSIEALKNIQELQPLLNQINNLKTAGDYNRALTLLIQAKGDYERAKIQANEGGYASVGVSGNGTSITSPNIDYTKATDTELGRYEGEELAILNNPNSTPMQKAMAQRRLDNIYTESGRRGYKTPQTPVERGSISFATYTPNTNFTLFSGATPATSQTTNQPQDLSGGGQPQQTQPITYQSPADADLAAYENKIRTKSKFGTEKKNRILGAISLQRNSSLFNAWGGIVGENDRYRGSVLVNGRPIPYSTNTAVNLTALGNDLTPLQRDLKQSLLLSGEFPVKSVNGKLEFDLDKLFPRIENNQVLTKPLIYGGGNYGQSSTNPIYR